MADKPSKVLWRTLGQLTQRLYLCGQIDPMVVATFGQSRLVVDGQDRTIVRPSKIKVRQPGDSSTDNLTFKQKI
jgi:hypothetical protein